MKSSRNSAGDSGGANNNSQNSNENNCRFFDSDIPCGFQDINPELFTIIAQILGDVISKDMPFNVQNALGNWFSLLGQTILTYNAQQQYFEDGPGNLYNIKNRNSGNSDCPSGGNRDSSNSNSDNINNISSSNSNSSSRDVSGKGNSNENYLESKISSLESEIIMIKKEIRKLNKSNK